MGLGDGQTRFAHRDGHAGRHLPLAIGPKSLPFPSYLAM